MTEVTFWTPIVAAAAALSGVWLQSHLGRRQTFRSRIWDLKREAYGEILSSLTEAEHHCAEMIFVLETLKLTDLSPVKGPAPEVSKLLDRLLDATGAVRRRFARDRLILPAEVVGVMEEFSANTRKLDSDTAVTLWRIKEMKSAIGSCRAYLESAARRDLNEES